MDDEATHLSLGEVRRIIGRLRGPDLVRLSLLGRVWAAGLRYHDPDDLLYEALDRILQERDAKHLRKLRRKTRNLNRRNAAFDVHRHGDVVLVICP